jgi:hypothetical protein
LLDREIGRDSVGVVYRARHALLRRPTALRLLRPDRVAVDHLDRVERAVREMSLLTHASAVAVFDFGYSPDGAFYYAMELIDGIDLAALAAQHGAQPPGRVIAILVQLCGALHEAEVRGVVDRRLEARHVLLCERGGVPDVAKVIELGLGDGRASPRDDVRAIAAIGEVLLGGDVPASPLGELLAGCASDGPTDPPALARALTALRVPDGWDAAAARAWWRAHRVVVDDADTAGPSATITVDLDARGR